MAVSLRKDIHRWLWFDEAGVSFCRGCGTVLDNGDTPDSEHCTGVHDARCVCNRCRPYMIG